MEAFDMKNKLYIKNEFTLKLKELTSSLSKKYI